MSTPIHGEIQDDQTGQSMVRPDTVGRSQSIPSRPHAMPAFETSTGALIDRAGALSRMGNDLELLQDMAAMFIRDVPKLMATLATSAEARDIDEVARAAHSVKGLAANFGAARCMQAAFVIEQSAKDRQLTDIENRRARLAEQVELLCGALRKEILASV